MNRTPRLFLGLLSFIGLPCCLNLGTVDPGAGGHSGMAAASASSSSGDGGSSGAGGNGVTMSPLPGWSYRRAIHVAPQNEALVDYMLLVATQGDGSVGAFAQADGDDLVFTDEDGKTVLPHDLQSFSVVSGQASFVAWVRVPSVPTMGKTLYLYYGHPVVSAQQNPGGAWTDYAAVYHLDNGFTDSTKNGLHALLNVAMPPAPSSTAAIVATGQSFSAQASAAAANAGEFEYANKSFTVSAWIRSGGISGHAVDHYSNNGTTSGWYVGTNATQVLFVYGGPTQLNLAASVAVGQWNHIMLVKSPGGATLYRNGMVADSKALPVGLADPVAPLYIGAGSPSSSFFNGSVDEVTIAPVERSAAWVSASYANMGNPGAFAAFDAPEKF